jgi:hypothetical protein
MIPYVQSASSQEVPPPYQFPGVTVNAFVWEADLRCVQAYCDGYFNLGDVKDRGFTYTSVAAWPYALLLFIDYPVMISSNRKPQDIGGGVPYSDRGIVSQKEVFVALPMMRYGEGPHRLLTETTLEWALPFIVVENPMSAICGREMLGLEKLRADIEFSQSTFPDSFRGRVSLPGWKTLEPTAMQQMLPFLDVDTGPVTPTFRGSAKQDSLWTLLRSKTAGNVIDGLATASDAVDALSAGLIPTSMQTVSLKQFRDAVQPDKAIYQALIGCRSKYSGIENVRFYNENDVDITFHDEGSFTQIIQVFLDLPQSYLSQAPTGRPYTFKPKAAFRFNANIDFDNMRTLHTFPVDRGPGLPPVAASSDLIAPWLRPWKGFFERPDP